MIERYLLRYFLAVIDSGTFTAAAAQMAVSQPTLSAGIAKLEREVGAKLLRRSSQRIELTEVHVSPHGDAVVPAFGTEWREVAREDHPAEGERPAYSFVTLERFP